MAKKIITNAVLIALGLLSVILMMFGVFRSEEAFCSIVLVIGFMISNNLDSIEYTLFNSGKRISPEDRIKIKIKKVNENAILPTRGSDKSAGYDLYACVDEYIKIPPHKTVKIPTGISVELPDGTFGAIYARSGLATKKGLAPANCVGVCDSDYRGEYIVALHNNSNFSAVVQPGDRIAQLIVHKYEQFDIDEAYELSDTDRGSGGFGSTGN